MDHFYLPLGSVGRGGRALRTLSRPLPLDQEQAAFESDGRVGREQGLSAQVPSPLVPTEKRAAALIIGGTPAWSRRLKRIDALTDAALERFERSWRAMAGSWRGKPEQFAAEWRSHAAAVDFGRVNELIRRHNEYFPAEANLAMDVHTGDFIGLGGGEYRRQLLDAAWVLDQFPADLSLALQGV